MKLMRIGFDAFYDTIKPIVFQVTKNNPEKAHDFFAWACRTLHETDFAKFILNNRYNKRDLGFTLANAAGFNKDAEIPPSILNLLGFDRVVIGTVTGEEWEGNDKEKAYYGRQRIIRFPDTGSMVNWLGLPGIGVERVTERLREYGDHGVPITINLMATPNKKGDKALKDLEKTMIYSIGVPHVDRFELNISCPNTSDEQGNLDARKEYQRQARDMIEAVCRIKDSTQDLDVKVSPNLTERGVDDTLEFIDCAKVRALTTTNSTTDYNPFYITEHVDKGGGSGNAVYFDSLRVQKLFRMKSRGTGLKFNACGGINSMERVAERVVYGATEIQSLTPNIFSGTKLQRRIRKYFS